MRALYTQFSFAICLVTLASCGLNIEAGSQINEGNFGAPTLNNMQIHSGQKTYVSDLSQRFASEVPTTVNFAFGSARLDAASTAILRQQAGWIKQFPEVRFRIYGHTDLVGGSASNQRLGLRRARAIVSYFASQGINRSRLEALSSLGETQPIVVTQSAEMRNRRAVTEVSGFVQNHPMVLNGKYAALVIRSYAPSGGG